MIDEDLVQRKIDIIYEQLDYIDTVKDNGREDFEDSFERKQAVKHSLQEAIEACIDIGNHIMAAEKMPRGDDLAEIFDTLGDHKVIGEELGVRLMEMAKFRNLLVHRYSRIDDERLWDIATRDVEDIEKFVEEIQSYISDQDP